MSAIRAIIAKHTKTAGVGDGDFEEVTGKNFGHLEEGQIYRVFFDRGETHEFLGWFDEEDTNERNLNGPEGVLLRFHSDAGFDWDAYYDDRSDKFLVGTSGEVLEVKEM